VPRHARACLPPLPLPLPLPPPSLPPLPAPLRLSPPEPAVDPLARPQQRRAVRCRSNDRLRVLNLDHNHRERKAPPTTHVDAELLTAPVCCRCVSGNHVACPLARRAALPSTGDLYRDRTSALRCVYPRSHGRLAASSNCRARPHWPRLSVRRGVHAPIVQTPRRTRSSCGRLANRRRGHRHLHRRRRHSHPSGGCPLRCTDCCRRRHRARPSTRARRPRCCRRRQLRRRPTLCTRRARRCRQATCTW